MSIPPLTTTGHNVAYARTGDGVRLAVSRAGAGLPIVQMPLVPWTTLSMTPQVIERLSGEGDEGLRRVAHSVVQYDARGSGLSEGDSLDLSMRAQLLDLDAVVSSLNKPVALIASTHAGPAAIAYAAQHPERLSHLVLWNAYASGTDFFDERRVEAVRGLLLTDWQLFCDTLALQMLGWDQPAAARRLAELIQSGVSRDEAARALKTLATLDVTSLLGDVQVPTLVLGRLGPDLPPAIARALAAAVRVASSPAVGDLVTLGFSLAGRPFRLEGRVRRAAGGAIQRSIGIEFRQGQEDSLEELAAMLSTADE